MPKKNNNPKTKQAQNIYLWLQFGEKKKSPESGTIFIHISPYLCLCTGKDQKDNRGTEVSEETSALPLSLTCCLRMYSYIYYRAIFFLKCFLVEDQRQRHGPQCLREATVGKSKQARNQRTQVIVRICHQFAVWPREVIFLLRVCFLCTISG